MAYKSFFSWQDIRNFGKDLMGNLQNEALQLQQGRVNPWELPRFKPMAQGIRTASSRNVEGMADTLRRTEGVGGPAGALALERVGQGGNDAVWNLANSINSGTDAQIGQGISIGQKAYDNALRYLMFKEGQGQSGGSIGGVDQIASSLGGMIGGMGKPGGGTQSPGGGGIQMNPDQFLQFLKMFQGGGMGGGMGGGGGMNFASWGGM
mgnify:CR=1 FL=1